MRRATTPVITGLAVLIAAMTTGCASVEYSSPERLANVTVKGVDGIEPRQHIVIETSGYFFLWTLPLFSGDLRWDPESCDIKGGTAFFKDLVGFAELQNALQKLAESRDCELADVYFNDTDGFYAGVSYTGIVGAFFGSSHMSVSAILVPRKSVAK